MLLQSPATRRQVVTCSLRQQQQRQQVPWIRSLSKLADSLLSLQDPQSFYTPEQKQIMQKTKELHASIMPLNEKLRGPLAMHSDQGTALPSVLLVGNHSSGKSSFINYVLGRPIQTAGVAPTDDSFTIIAPGPIDVDQDGPALIGDPDLGFAPLRQFGPTLMHHTQLKIRRDINSSFIMIDSPGMIDAPANYSGIMLQQQQQQQQQGQQSSSSAVMDRGYDFTGVVRWLADRADIVCLFFDPDKPGTTGETLSVLLHALSGMDHKLLIVLNKADQFQRIHDFARAYGSLCWNLSKVIPRKDLPRIFTMCLPGQQGQKNDSNQQQQDEVGGATKAQQLSGLQDLHTARDEVVEEVRKAPQRRLDNLLTSLYDAAAQLEMHGRIVKDLQSRSSRFYWQEKRQEFGLAVTGLGLSAAFGALSYYGSVPVPASVTGSLLAATVLATSGLAWYHGRQLEEWQIQASEPEELSAAFQRAYARQVSEGDEYSAALWQRIRGPLGRVLRQDGLDALAKVTDADLQGLIQIMQHELPALRRRASPPHYGKAS